jgi:hypothetical protein
MSAKICGRIPTIGCLSQFKDIVHIIIMEMAVALCPPIMENQHAEKKQNTLHKNGEDIVVTGLTKPSAREYKTSIHGSASQL